MNNDLISRAEAIDVIRSMTINLEGKEIFHPEAKKSVLGALDELPTIDAELVRHGRWVGKRWSYSCSICGGLSPEDGGVKTNYCPNCGAKMDLEVQDA